MRFRNRGLLMCRVACVAAFTIMTFILASSSTQAQQQSSQSRALANLARVGCDTGNPMHGSVDLDTGYIAMLGVSEKTYSMQVLNNGRHALMIPTEQCRDPRPLGQKPFSFILSHFFQNRNHIREGYYYLMNLRGQLVNAVHFQEGRSHIFAFTDPNIPVRRADFEAEKAIWISKFAALAAPRNTKYDAD